MRRSPSPSPLRPDLPAAADGLPPDAGAVLLPLARAAIAEAFGDRVPADDSAPWLRAPGCCFVTLTTRGLLHGCIGSTEPRRPLLDDVRDNAVAAAVRDRRFPQLTRAELAETRIEVSVLGPSVAFPVTDEADARARLRPGVDGVVLLFAGRRATFLPQVWERLSDPAEFLAHLKVKLGLPPTFWSDDLSLRRYTVTAFHEEERP
ncbi:MAG: AmmeMemoRadiSam system protein A [Nocardioidaceae bacterium]